MEDQAACTSFSRLLNNVITTHTFASLMTQSTRVTRVSTIFNTRQTSALKFVGATVLCAVKDCTSSWTGPGLGDVGPIRSPSWTGLGLGDVGPIEGSSWTGPGLGNVGPIEGPSWTGPGLGDVGPIGSPSWTGPGLGDVGPIRSPSWTGPGLGDVGPIRSPSCRGSGMWGPLGVLRGLGLGLGDV